MTVKNTASSGFQRLGKSIRSEAEKAVGVALLSVLDDAQNEDPKPPIDTGLLRGSQFAIIGDQIIGKTPTTRPQSDESGIVGYVGFDTPYAFYVHEGLEPGPGLENRGQLQPGPRSQAAGGVGGLFLSLKLNRNRDNYVRIITDRLKRFLGGA